jgi:VWFA-related protein
MHSPDSPTFTSGWHILTLAVATTLLFARLAAGQQSSVGSGQSGQADAENYKFTVRSNLVLLPTRVQSKTGETIYGLKPEQFIVEDNGVRQSVQVDEEPDSPGLSLVVVVQCSRSAPSEFNKLKGLGTMVDAIVGDAPHEIAVLSYGEAPYVLGDFSRSSDAARLAFSRLKPCGNFHAATIDAVYYAINMLKRRQSHYRRAILLISETRDHGSRSKLHEVVAQLGVTDTVIYSVAFSPAKDELVDGFRASLNPPKAPSFPPPKPPPPSPQPAEASSTTATEPLYTDHAPPFEWPPQLLLVVNALRRDSASELASLSGGEHFNFTTKRAFDQSLERIANRVHNYYLLRFQPSGPIMILHSLRVRVEGYPDAVIQTRRNYWSGIFDSSTGDVR